MDISPKVVWGLGAAGVIVVGILFYAFRAGDPAARPSIPYKKIDYGAYMQQHHIMDRHPSTSASAPPSGKP